MAFMASLLGAPSVFDPARIPPGSPQPTTQEILRLAVEGYAAAAKNLSLAFNLAQQGPPARPCAVVPQVVVKRECIDVEDWAAAEEEKRVRHEETERLAQEAEEQEHQRNVLDLQRRLLKLEGP